MSWRRYRIYSFWIAVINIIARMWTHCCRIWSIHSVDKIFSVRLDNFKYTTRICSIGTIIHLRITLGKINSLGNSTKFETVGKISDSIRVFFWILWIGKNQEIIFNCFFSIYRIQYFVWKKRLWLVKKGSENIKMWQET